jgi:hypothetical protein
MLMTSTSRPVHACWEVPGQVVQKYREGGAWRTLVARLHRHHVVLLQRWIARIKRVHVRHVVELHRQSPQLPEAARVGLKPEQAGARQLPAQRLARTQREGLNVANMILRDLVF